MSLLCSAYARRTPSCLPHSHVLISPPCPSRVLIFQRIRRDNTGINHKMVASLSVLRQPAKTGGAQRDPSKTSPVKPHTPQPTLRKKWCGKYCLDAAKYSEDTVGPKAIQLQHLQRSVGSAFQIENTVSIPFGTIPEVLESHYENSGAATQVRQACAVDESQYNIRSRSWKQCRSALSQMKIPALMTEDVLSSYFAQGMAVPTTKHSWEQLRTDIADSAALLFTPTYVDSVDNITNPLDLPVSLLVRDMQPREYDFSVTLESSGDVSGEVRLPYSTNRGIRFATQGPGTEPGTTRPPSPNVGYAVCSGTVALDGVYLPQAVSRHHAATAWTPPKGSFEGDSMLVLPQYKQEVYNRLTDMVRRMFDLIPLGGSTFSVTGYITKRMEIIISDVTSDEGASHGNSFWSWDPNFV